MKRFILLLILTLGIVLLGACATNDGNSDTEIQDEPEEVEDNHIDTDTNTEVSDKEKSSSEEADHTENTDIVGINEDEQSEENDRENEVVLENDAFRIYEPAPETVVENEFVVRGEARVFEGTVMYEFEDGHNILDKGFVTASEGAPGWGEFEIIIKFNEVAYNNGMIILYEESAKDGSRVNELIIPVVVE